MYGTGRWWEWRGHNELSLNNALSLTLPKKKRDFRPRSWCARSCAHRIFPRSVPASFVSLL